MNYELLKAGRWTFLLGGIVYGYYRLRNNKTIEFEYN
jgi:hypothetical protein